MINSAEGTLEEGLLVSSTENSRVSSLLATEKRMDIPLRMRSERNIAEEKLLSIADEPIFLSFQKEMNDNHLIQGWKENFNCLYLSSHSHVKQKD